MECAAGVCRMCRCTAGAARKCAVFDPRRAAAVYDSCSLPSVASTCAPARESLVLTVPTARGCPARERIAVPAASSERFIAGTGMCCTTADLLSWQRE